MHIIKKILLGSVLLPVLFVATLLVSSVTNTTPEAEAAAKCRLQMSVDGTEMGDKEEIRSFTFTQDEVNSGIDLVGRYKHEGAKNKLTATLQVPGHVGIANPLAVYHLRGYYIPPEYRLTDRWFSGGKYVYSFPTNDKDQWFIFGTPTDDYDLLSNNIYAETPTKIYGLQDGDRIELNATAKAGVWGSDSCKLIANINVEPENFDVRISGPSPVQLPSGYETYRAEIDYPGDSVDYRFYIPGEMTDSWGTMTGHAVSRGINWDNYGAGTYQVCAEAKTVNGDSKTACMTVDVTPDPNSVSVSLSGPSSFQLPSGYDSGPQEAHYAGFDYSTDSVDYRFYISGVMTRDWRTFSGDGVYTTFDWDSYGEGTYQVCAEGRIDNGDSDTSCMTVDVFEGGDATLRVESQNPSSGVGMDTANNSAYKPGQRFETTQTFSESGDIDIRLFAEPVADNGNEFGYWDGCDSEDGANNRACNIVVNQGQSKIIRAVYNKPQDPNKATVRVRSQNPSSGVGMDIVYGTFPDQHFTTSQSSDLSHDGDIRMVIWASPGPYNGNDFHSWDGCGPNSGPDPRRCDVSVDQGQAKTIIASYKNPDSPAVYGCTDPSASNYNSNATVNDGSCYYPPAVVYGCTDPGAVNYDSSATNDDGSCLYQAEINNFSVANDPDVDFSVNPPEIHVDDQPFQLIWSTTNANSVTASGDWSGSKSTSGNEYMSESVPGNSATYSYTLTAQGSGGNDSGTVSITVLDPPHFELSSEPETEIDGEPGSTATNQVTVTSYKYSGNVLLEVLDSGIPENLKDADGNSKVAFTFSPSSVNSAGNSLLTIEILQPIYENLFETITITGTDQSDTAEPKVMTTQFILIIDGFNPRTIEEF